MLDKQIDIYSLDTGNFYDNRESYLHWLNHKLRSERNQLLNGAVIKGNDGKVKKTIVGIKNIESKFESFGIDKDCLASIAKDEYDFSLFGDDSKELSELGCEYRRLKALVSLKNAKSMRQRKGYLPFCQIRLKRISHQTEDTIQECFVIIKYLRRILFQYSIHISREPSAQNQMSYVKTLW